MLHFSVQVWQPNRVQNNYTVKEVWKHVISLRNRGSKHLHGFQNQRKMIQEWVDGHSEDPRFICSPPPETYTQQQFSRGYLKIVYTLRRNKTCFSHRKRAAWQRELFFYATFPWFSIRRQRTQGDDGLSGWWERDIQRTAKGSRTNLSFQNSNFFTSSCYCVFLLFSLFSVNPPPREIFLVIKL